MNFDNDDKLTLRKQRFDFTHSFNIKDNIQSIDEYHLSLRKDRLFKLFMNNHIEYKENEIQSKCINRPNLSFSTITSESNFKTQMEMLKDFIYHYYSSDFNKDETDYLINKLLPKASIYLFDKQSDLLTKENIVLIFIDLFNEFIYHLISVVFLTQLEQEISLALSSIAIHHKYLLLLLVLLANLLSADKENNNIITNAINIPKIINASYVVIKHIKAKDNDDNTANDKDNNFMKILFLLITNFLFYKDIDNKELQISLAETILIPEIIAAYYNMNSHIFFAAIRALNLFCHCSSSISLIASNPDLLSILNEIMITKANQSTVIEIFPTLLSGTNHELSLILNDKLVQCFIDNIVTFSSNIQLKCGLASQINKEQGQIVISSIRSLSFIISNDYNQYHSIIILNKETNVIESLLSCFKHFKGHNDNLQREIINFFIKGMSSSNQIAIEAFINVYQIHKVFYLMMVEFCLEQNCFEGKEFINGVLTVIDAVLVCSMNKKRNSNGTDLYLRLKDDLQQLDFVDNLIKILFKYDSDAISNKIEFFLSRHWNENEMYYNVSSEYMNVR